MPSESSQIHPARLPDPQRVKTWREYIEIVHRDVTKLLWWRDVDNRFSEFVRTNDHILHGQSDFPAITRQWYSDAACIAIRRLVDQGSEGPVYSLRRLLESMKRYCEAFNRNSVDELLEEPSAPKYDPDFRAYIVDSVWGKFKDPTEGTDRLLSDKIKADLVALEQASAKIKRYADLRIAHHSHEEIPKADIPTWSEVNRCIDVVHDVTKRWIAPLTGAGYSSLVPIFQGDWYDIFASQPKRKRSA